MSKIQFRAWCEVTVDGKVYQKGDLVELEPAVYKWLVEATAKMREAEHNELEDVQGTPQWLDKFDKKVSKKGKGKAE